MNEKHRTNAFERILRAFKTRWLLPFLGGLFGLTVALVLAFAIITPKYESQSQIIVNHEGDAQNTSLYHEALTSSTVLDPVIEAVPELSATDDIRQDIAVDASEDTGILTISTENRSPKLANEMNQQLTESFIDAAPNLLSVSRVELLSRASKPSEPISPVAWLYAVVGTVLGIIVMSIVLIVQALRDDAIYSESIVNDLGWELVGVIPEISKEEIELTRFKRNLPPMTDNTETKRRF
ncbi:YveK family protein [Aerococcus vaginalis]